MKLGFRKLFLFVLPLLLSSCHVSRGNGGSALGFMAIFLFPVIIAVIIALYRNEKHQLKYVEKSSGLWARYKGLFLFLIITVSVGLGVQSIGEPNLKTKKDRLEYFVSLNKIQFTRKDYMDIFKDISSATASRDLKKGTELKIFEKIGELNKTIYKLITGHNNV